MTLDELSAQAAAVGKIYCDRFGIVPDEAFYLGKLSEELGEICATVLKLSHRSRGADTPLVEREAHLRDELADLFGFLLMFAESRGIDLGAALTAKWGRYLIAELEA